MGVKDKGKYGKKGIQGLWEYERGEKKSESEREGMRERGAEWYWGVVGRGMKRRHVQRECCSILP